jgi:alkylation response protein AidB-like acyl-CoA dehydrogenase
MTEPDKKTRGMTAFLVDGDAKGLSIGKIEDKMGIRASQTGELILKDVRVPKSKILGDYNKGFKVALSCIDGSRICIAAAQALGMSEEAFELAIKYSKERVQFGAPIAENQGIQWYLAEMKAKLEASRLITYTAAKTAHVKKRYSEEASIAKLVASENARFIIERALQIHGGYGYMTDYPLERMYRDQKITEIYEGTNEVCKMVIGRTVIL